MAASLVLADRPTGRPALVALAGAVEASGVGRHVTLDLARGPEAIVAALGEARRAGRDAVVAWSFFSSDAARAAADLDVVRSSGEEALHVAGGVHATAEPEETVALGFDLVARGEGERTVVELLARVLEGAEPRTVPGLCWSTESGSLATSGRAEPVDLDAVPASSVHLGKALAAEVTRGCIWACRFCQTPFLHRARFRHRGVAGVRAWARHGVALGHRDFRFLTPSALSYGAEGPEVRLDALEALLAAVREEIGPSRRIFFGTFPSEVRPEHVSPAALALLRRWVDNRELLVGGQSGSDRLLTAMDRGHGVAEIERAVALALEAGFVPSVDFVVGFPGETEEDRQATRRLMARVAEQGARVHGHAFLPLPGTPWRDQPPGELDGATLGLLDRLASRGRAFGQWRSQERLGRELVRPRRPR